MKHEHQTYETCRGRIPSFYYYLSLVSKGF